MTALSVCERVYTVVTISSSPFSIVPNWNGNGSNGWSINKLAADLERGWEGEHELTAGDVRAYADIKALADAQRAGARKATRRRPGVSAETQQESPWHNFGI